MKKITFAWLITVLFLSVVLSSCSKDSVVDEENHDLILENKEKSALVFNARFSRIQKENFQETGEVFLPQQQKDSWNDTIPNNVPTKWGVFEYPSYCHTKAVGIAGSYPARYWSMVRLKIGKIDARIADALNNAVDSIESKTNVRFYNAQNDKNILEQHHIELPDVFVDYAQGNLGGSGSYGMVGGQQYINVPKELDDSILYKDEEVTAFLMHALCNAAGMFNEIQRRDRDDYVKIYWDNIPKECRQYFNKIGKNYTTLGYFDYNSITMLSSKAYSKNGENTIVKISGGGTPKNIRLSELDIAFLNSHYLPYIARTDMYIELDSPVYYRGRVLTEQERMDFQRQLNERRGLYGDPPAGNRIERELWYYK